MAIDKLFFAGKRPARYCVIGTGGVECFLRERRGLRRLHAVETSGWMNMNPDDGERLAAKLGKHAWGVFLRSDAFIFNVFDFERLPHGEARRRELAQWRLEKVFPEDTTDFIHAVLHPGGKRLLSVLLSKKDAVVVENWFREHSIRLTFLGNSTIELMNRLWAGKLKTFSRPSPQVLVELDHQLGMVVFQDSGRPYYIRKFRCDSEDGFRREMRKTLEFVKSNYTRTPRTVAFFPGKPVFTFSQPTAIWRELELRLMAIPAGVKLTLPGGE